MNEQILTGKKYRVLADESTGLWNRISFWNKAADTEMDDGTSVEEKVTDLTSDLNTLNENLTIDGNYKFKVGRDGDGNVCYYGADGSLIPFKKSNNTTYIPTDNTTKIRIPVDKKPSFVCVSKSLTKNSEYTSCIYDSRNYTDKVFFYSSSGTPGWRNLKTTSGTLAPIYDVTDTYIEVQGWNSVGLNQEWVITWF